MEETLKETSVANAATFKKFGELKAGDLLYGIAKEPLTATVSSVKVEMRAEPGKTEMRPMAIIYAPEFYAHGDLVVPAEHHLKEINPALSITSSHDFFKRNMESKLRPLIDGMEKAIKRYKELLGE